MQCKCMHSLRLSQQIMLKSFSTCCSVFFYTIFFSLRLTLYLLPALSLVSRISSIFFWVFFTMLMLLLLFVWLCWEVHLCFCWTKKKKNLFSQTKSLLVLHLTLQLANIWSRWERLQGKTRQCRRWVHQSAETVVVDVGARGGGSFERRQWRFKTCVWRWFKMHFFSCAFRHFTSICVDSVKTTEKYLVKWTRIISPISIDESGGNVISIKYSWRAQKKQSQWLI